MASPQFVGGSVNSLTVGWRRCEYHMPMAAAAAPAAAMLAIPSRAPHEVSAERLVVLPRTFRGDIYSARVPSLKLTYSSG